MPKRHAQLTEQSIGPSKGCTATLASTNSIEPFNERAAFEIQGKLGLGLLAAFGLGISSPAVWAQEKGSALKAWAAIQQSVKDMETAVQSKTLYAIHDPSMKIRSSIRTLKGHSSMLSGDKGQKVSAALKQLDSSVTDLHSAADEGNQAKAEEALKSLENASDQLKAEDPESAFKGM